MTEPISDALFGVDGTELPPLSPDPSGRGTWPDSSVLPPMPLPAMPKLDMTREEIAAALGESPHPSLDPAGSTTNGTMPATSAMNGTGTTNSVPPASPPPAAAAPPPPQEKKPPVDPTRPIIVTAVTPAAPRGNPGSSFRSSLANGSFPRVHIRDTRRRFSRLSRRLPAQSRSNGGAGAFFVIMIITFAVLLYFIITGIVDSFARLIP